MHIKKNIRKILAGAFWCLVAAGLLALLGASVRVKNNATCSGYEIRINGLDAGLWFIDKKDIEQLITANGIRKIKGRNLQDFNTQKMEERLEKDVWINDAELFFDNNNSLQVVIDEREPIARIFTSQGSSFYIDSALKKLPLSEKMSAKLPVFTGFPSTMNKRSLSDSLLLVDIRKMSEYILNHPFWMAQVTQINITPAKEFELVPMIGNHTIEFGRANDYENKFRKLFVFYRQVLAKTGMESYSAIKLQYSDQVVAVKNPAFTSRVDSLQAIKRVEDLISATYDTVPAFEEGEAEGER